MNLNRSSSSAEVLELHFALKRSAHEKILGNEVEFSRPPRLLSPTKRSLDGAARHGRCVLQLPMQASSTLGDTFFEVHDRATSGSMSPCSPKCRASYSGKAVQDVPLERMSCSRIGTDSTIKQGKDSGPPSPSQLLKRLQTRFRSSSLCGNENAVPNVVPDILSTESSHFLLQPDTPGSPCDDARVSKSQTLSPSLRLAMSGIKPSDTLVRTASMAGSALVGMAVSDGSLSRMTIHRAASSDLVMSRKQPTPSSLGNVPNSPRAASSSQCASPSKNRVSIAGDSALAVSSNSSSSMPVKDTDGMSKAYKALHDSLNLPASKELSMPKRRSNFSMSGRESGQYIIVREDRK